MDEAFKAHVAKVLEEYFQAAPTPDGSEEGNRLLIVIRERAFGQLHRHIRRKKVAESVRHAMREYAEGAAHHRVYKMYEVPVKKNPRYKGMQGV